MTAWVSAESHKHHSGLNHIFYHVVGWFGISDHKGGVLLLLFSVFLKMGYDSNFRHLAVEVGGPKRLYGKSIRDIYIFCVTHKDLFQQ